MSSFPALTYSNETIDSYNPRVKRATGCNAVRARVGGGWSRSDLHLASFYEHACSSISRRPDTTAVGRAIAPDGRVGILEHELVLPWTRLQKTCSYLHDKAHDGISINQVQKLWKACRRHLCPKLQKTHVRASCRKCAAFVCAQAMTVVVQMLVNLKVARWQGGKVLQEP
jgi:hypothetical protein